MTRRALPLLLALCLAALPVRAAEPHAQDRETARALFEQGKSEMAVGRFAEAREHLQKSLDLVARPSVAFNLAVALRGMGRPKESALLLRRMLAGDFGALPADRQAEVLQLEQEVRRDIARVVISASGAPSIQVRIDGVLVATLTSGQPRSLETNPGERVVTLSARHHDPIERTLVLVAGKSQNLSATLVQSRSARQEQSSVLKSPWFWVGAGTVVAGALVGGYFVFREREREPVTDPEFKITETLRF
jgi:hypothetical protein